MATLLLNPEDIDRMTPEEVEAAYRLWQLGEIKPQRSKYREYAENPIGYSIDVLNQRWWRKQQEVAEALLNHKKVAVKASHSVGKSHLAGGLVNWYFDAFNPGIVLTTAPTKDQVVDILWKRVREQRPNKADLQPKAPRMEDSETHFAVGYTARDANSFQGRHEERLLIIFDEADGVEEQFFDAAEGMATGPDNRILFIYNPVGSGTRMEMEEENPDTHVITISALEHPNIIAQLQGLPMPFPKAVSLEWVEEKFRTWCSHVTGSHKATDVEFPPGSGIWYRPGPLFETRVLGRRASLGINTVWSDALWEACLTPQPEPIEEIIIGCDVARFGDDFTSMTVRRGNCALHHETHNGWGTDETAGRLKQLCNEYARRSIQEARTVVVNIDDDGIGGGVWDQRGDYNFIRCSGASSPYEPDGYPNRRSEIWFAVADRANEQRIDVSRLSDDMRQLIRRQLKSPTWKLDNQGRRLVEPKSDTKKRLKRSPDDADSFNLCFQGEGRGVVADDDAYKAFWGQDEDDEDE